MIRMTDSMGLTGSPNRKDRPTWQSRLGRREKPVAAVAAIIVLLLGLGISLVSSAVPVSMTVPFSTTPVADADL
ncbi:MAG: hypothetical protein ACE5HJ_09865, partial [Thermoplasmata archaeon]